ncbi:MAG: hypothetical protein IJD50_06845 [Clostridia bacterium]|nr:hypothetical protein [Clostridia bacterium]
MINMLLAFENLTPMNPEVLKASLNILWQGLLAIFIVIALIIVAVSVTTDLIAKAKAYKEKNGEFSIKKFFKKK